MQRLMNAFSGGGRAAGGSSGPADPADPTSIVLPDPYYQRALERDWQTANDVGAREMVSERRDARTQARMDAVINTVGFFPMRLDPKQNAEYVCLDQFERVTPQDHAALRRQNSFLSIKKQLGDIDALTRPSQAGDVPPMDADTRAVLEESLKTVKLASLLSQQTAFVRARAGQRALPLTLDTVRMNAYLADHERDLAQVVQGCRGGAGDGARLTEPLRALATDYLRRNRQLPFGLLPSFGTQFRGNPITDPVTVFAGTFPDTTVEYEKGATGIHDALVLSIGRDTLAGPLEEKGHLVTRFRDHPPAQERAAFVLQSFFHLLTSVEEMMRMEGMHAGSERERRENAGTRAEWTYAGSHRLGDATTLDNERQSQRSRALQSLSELTRRNAAHRATYGEPMVTDPKLADWVETSLLVEDCQTLAATHPRLAAAQVQGTAEALLQSRAFGGPGLR